MKVKLQVFNFAESFMEISSRLTLEFLRGSKKRKKNIHKICYITICNVISLSKQRLRIVDDTMDLNSS